MLNFQRKKQDETNQAGSAERAGEAKARHHRFNPAEAAAALVVLCFCVFALGALISRQQAPEDFDVMYLHDGSQIVTSIRTEGSIGFQASQHADTSPIRKGEHFAFSSDQVGWPMTVAVYKGPDLNEQIAETVLPEAPGEGQYWLLELADRQGEMVLVSRLATRS